MCKNSVHPFKILSHTITSRENVYRIFHLLGEPKTLNLAKQLKIWYNNIIRVFLLMR